MKCFSLLATCLARARQVALPSVPIPLQSPDADVIVELQSVFAEAFARGGYEERLHYGAPRVLASHRPTSNGPQSLPRPRCRTTSESPLIILLHSLEAAESTCAGTSELTFKVLV